MAIPYKNPTSPLLIEGTTTIGNTSTFGNTFSVYNIGGYMEVGSLDDLIYTVPTGTTGSIEYSGNTIPIEFLKGSGNPYSPDVLTLYSDNISSGRRRLGMLVYVHEEDQVYQFHISGYTSLFTAATASTNCVVISDFGTIVKNNTVAGQNFINAWTASTIEDVNGYTNETATWRKFNTGTGGGGSGFTSVRINNVSQFTSSSNSYINFSGVNVDISYVSTNTLVFSAGTGGGGGSSNLQYFITGSTPSGVTINSGDRWFDTNTGVEVVYINDGDSSQWVRPSVGTVQLFTGNTSASCVTNLYVSNIYGCSPININDLVIANSGLITTNLTATTISATTYQNIPSQSGTGVSSLSYTPTTGVLTLTKNDTTTVTAGTFTYLTGVSYSNNVVTLTNNNGGSSTATINTFTGITVNGVLTVTGNTSLQGLTASTISATTYQNIPIKYYAEFSGAPSTSPIVLGTDSISIGNGAESRSTFMLSFGTNAGKNATGTTVSNFIGSGAGYDASGSTYVNFIGSNAGYGAINANSSTFLNTASGNFSTGATYSNFFGTSAGESSKDLNYSNVLGYQAGLGVTNAQNVNYFGRQSGWYAINATFSNFIGFGAGTSATNASYSNFIGSNAGTQASSASFSNLIGFNAGKLFVGNNIGSNNIIIGTNLSLPSGATNSINIGGVLFGTGTYSNTGTDPSIVPSNGKIGINVVNPVTTLDVSGTTRITGGLTASSITSTGVTTLGSGTFTKAGAASGDILLDNGSTDTPGLLLYHANNTNWGIDSNNQTFGPLNGQLLRFVGNLNEAGGAVRAAMDTTGNLVTNGFVLPNSWRAGQIVLDTMLSNTEVTVTTTTIATSTSDTDFVTYSYTPLSSNSYLIIHYHLADYSFASGTGNDSYISRIKVDGSEITYSKQSTVNGNRSGVLFPLTGRYTNSSTSAKSIVVACRRDSADDSITIVNSSTSMWLRITEIGR